MAEERKDSDSSSDGEMMQRIDTDNGTQLTQSMKSNTDIVRVGDDTTSMASLGMSGRDGGGNDMSMASLQLSQNDYDKEQKPVKEAQSQDEDSNSDDGQGQVIQMQEEETGIVIKPTADSDKADGIQAIAEENEEEDQSNAHRSEVNNRDSRANNPYQDLEDDEKVGMIIEEGAPDKQDSRFDTSGDRVRQTETESQQRNGLLPARDEMIPPPTPSNKLLIDELEDCANHGSTSMDDSVIFNTAMLRSDEEKLANIFVGDPVDRNGKIHFKVKAFDFKGDFEILRRFSEFEALRKAFLARLPGLYIPRLPKSSFFGDSKDKQFLAERCFHLEQFMKKVVKLPYLLQSGELQVFTRPDTEDRDKDGKVIEIEKQLANLPEQTIEMLAFRMKSITNFDQVGIHLSSKKLEQMGSVIINTQIFLKTHERFLQDVVQMIRAFMQSKDKYLLSDRYVSEFMEKYERLNLQGYNSGGYAYRESKRILSKAEEEHKNLNAETAEVSAIAESIRVRNSADSELAKPSLMARMKNAMGMKVEQAVREEEKKGEEVEMLDEQGHIQYRKLNNGLLKKYKNPFRILYLWAVQEVLEVAAILECIKAKEELEERRRKMMRKIKMTAAELDSMRPSRTSNVKDMFEDDQNDDTSKSNAATNYEVQKDVVELVCINEMLTSFLAKDILPRFRHERVYNYKKIMAQFSKMERMNSKNIIIMWQSIMRFHSEKAQEEMRIDDMSPYQSVELNPTVPAQV